MNIFLTFGNKDHLCLIDLCSLFQILYIKKLSLSSCRENLSRYLFMITWWLSHQWLIKVYHSTNQKKMGLIPGKPHSASEFFSLFFWEKKNFLIISLTIEQEKPSFFFFQHKASFSPCGFLLFSNLNHVSVKIKYTFILWLSHYLYLNANKTASNALSIERDREVSLLLF